MFQPGILEQTSPRQQRATLWKRLVGFFLRRRRAFRDQKILSMLGENDLRDLGLTRGGDPKHWLDYR